MRFHLEEHIESLVMEGMSSEEARLTALREFGNVEALKEECRDSWGMWFIDSTIRYLKLAVRQMIKHKGFASVIILTLGIGIGVNTMVFSVLNGLIFKQMDIANWENLVRVSSQNLQKSSGQRGVSYLDFRDFQEQNNTFEGLEAATGSQVVISEEREPPIGYDIRFVSSGYLRLLETHPFVGRDFAVEDHKIGAVPVMIIGYRVWYDHFAQDPDIVGKSVTANGVPATIVGVMSKDLVHPSWPECWMPLNQDRSLDRENRHKRNLQLIGILKKDATIGKARAELTVIAQRIASLPGNDESFEVVVQTNRETIPKSILILIFLIQGSVVFVFLIACANVANLMIGRAIHRRFEISVRAAMGATRWQLVRQLVTESVALSLIGGLLGLAISVCGIHLYSRLGPPGIRPFMHMLSMDYRVFAFLAAISLLSGILFGLFPAIRATRIDLNSTLNENTKTSISRRGGKLTGALVVFQFALTVALLTNAGLMVHGFLSGNSVNEFIPHDEILTAIVPRTTKTGAPSTNGQKKLQFYRDLVHRLKELPGVTHAAVGSSMTGLIGTDTKRVEIEDSPIRNSKNAEQTYVSVQSPDYLSALGLPILIGRDFLDTDETQGEHVSIVTKRFADQHWPGQSAIGKRFRFLSSRDSGPWRSVVGVSSNILAAPLDPDSDSVIFTPLDAKLPLLMFLLVRAPNPQAQARAVWEVVQDLDPAQPLRLLQTAQELKDMKENILSQVGSLFSSFAFIAMAMASMGVYAVAAQSSASRVKEIGVRKALGATASKIQSLMVSRGIKQLISGMVIGLPLAFAIALVLENMFSLSPKEPLVIATVALSLLSVGTLACWLPARKASIANPRDSLRME
jgi:putative ABC transport system permease protein